jgi:hypothetical protein
MQVQSSVAQCTRRSPAALSQIYLIGAAEHSKQKCFCVASTSRAHAERTVDPENISDQYLFTDGGCQRHLLFAANEEPPFCAIARVAGKKKERKKKIYFFFLFNRLFKVEAKSAL